MLETVMEKLKTCLFFSQRSYVTWQLPNVSQKFIHYTSLHFPEANLFLILQYFLSEPQKHWTGPASCHPIMFSPTIFLSMCHVSCRCSALVTLNQSSFHCIIPRLPWKAATEQRKRSRLGNGCQKVNGQCCPNRKQFFPII